MSTGLMSANNREYEKGRLLLRSARSYKRVSVAVVIPYYNGSEFVERAIKSVVDQTVPADELIIVNDGSSPEEASFLHNLASIYGFKVISKANGGQGSARNAGVSEAKSDFISFLDQDDFYLENHIEVLINELPKDLNRFGYIYADLMVADVDGYILQRGVVKEHSPLHPKTDLIDMLRNDMFVLPSASLISRKAFNHIGGFDPQFTGYEDDDLFMRFFRRGFNSFYVDIPVTVWCIHSGSTSYSIKMSRSRWRYFKKLVEKIPDVPSRACYYMRDCLVPRFESSFLADAKAALVMSEDHRAEVFGILKEYSELISKNKSIPGAHRRRIRLISWLYLNFPVGLLRIVTNQKIIKRLVMLIF